jgi:hypothetical protein
MINFELGTKEFKGMKDKKFNFLSFIPLNSFIPNSNKSIKNYSQLIDYQSTIKIIIRHYLTVQRKKVFFLNQFSRRRDIHEFI